MMVIPVSALDWRAKLLSFPIYEYLFAQSLKSILWFFSFYGMLYLLCAVLLFVIVRLRNSNIRVKFVTNTTKESLCSVHEKLTKMGFDVGREELFTSLTAAQKFIERRSLRPFLLLEESAKDDFSGQLSAFFHAVVYQSLALAVCTYLFAHIR